MMKALAILGWVVAVPFLALVWLGGGFEQSGANNQSRFESQARSSCITMLRRGLHNPRSASWVNSTQWPVSLQDDGLYSVSMTYRAENAFGGTVTENARCIVRRDEAEAFAVRIN